LGAQSSSEKGLDLKRVKRGLWITSAVAILVFVAAALFAARLAREPLAIGFADSFVRAQAAGLFPGYELSFETPTLFWNRGPDTLDLQLINIELKKEGGASVAHLPQLGVALSLDALLRGKIEPTRIDLFGPQIHFDWSAENVRNRLMASTAEGAEPGEPLVTNERTAIVQLVEELLGGEAATGRLPELTTVRIEHGEVWLRETASGAVWLFPDTTLMARRNGKAVSLDVDLKLEAAGTRAMLRFNFEPQGPGAGQVDLEVSGLDIGTLADTVGLETEFGYVQAPLAGLIAIRLADSRIDEVRFDLSMGEGLIYFPNLFAQPPLVKQAAALGDFQAAERVLRIETFDILLTSGNINGDMLLTLPGPDGGKPSMRLDAVLEDADIRQVLNYWPQRLAPGGRRWVDLNVAKGHVLSLKATARFDADDWGRKPLAADALRLDFSFENAEAHYRRPMPPLVGARGIGIFVGSNLDISVDEGSTDGIPVFETKFRARNLGDRKRHNGEVTARADAPLRDVLRLIDYEPLQITSRNKINPEAMDGVVSAAVRFRFPLARGTPAQQIRYDVSATLSEFEIPALFRDGGLSGGLLDVQVNNKGLAASGRVHLKEAPFDLIWRQRFGTLPAGTLPTTYELGGAMTANDLERFGLPALGRMSGTARAEIMIEGRGIDLVRGKGRLDLFRSEIDAPRFAWSKDANTEGVIHFDLNWTPQQLKIGNINVNSSGLQATGQLASDRETGLLDYLRFSKIETSGTKMVLNYQVRGLKVPALQMEAERFDASFYLTRLFEPSQAEKPPLDIELFAKEASGLNGIKFTDVKLSALAPEGDWLVASITGLHQSGEPFTVDLSVSDTERILNIRSDNAGLVGLALDIFPNGSGGRLRLDATIPDHKGLDGMEGRLSINDLRVVKSSALLTALSEQKPRGLDEMIGENGLTFKRVILPYTINQGVIDIAKGRANGPAIGFTLEGQMDRARQLIHINGVMVPAFALNSLLSRMPIVGEILTGGEGEGIFAVTYRVEGNLEDPKVTINPLSALAPGVLRKLFEGPKGELPSEEAEQEPPESSPNRPRSPRPH
jgi:hypothetical protein